MRIRNVALFNVSTVDDLDNVDPGMTPTPAGFVAVVGVAAGTVSCSWDEVVSDPLVTSYTVEYKLSSDPVWSQQPAGLATSALISGLAGGMSYDFRVFATSPLGDSVPGNVISVTPLSATAPVLDSVVPDFLSLVYSWSGDISDDGYDLEYRPFGVPGTGWTRIQISIATSYQIRGLVGGQLYDARIRSRSNGDVSPYSSIVQATPLGLSGNRIITWDESTITIPPAGTGSPISLIENSGTLGAQFNLDNVSGAASGMTYQERNNRPCMQVVGAAHIASTSTPSQDISPNWAVFFGFIPFFLDTSDRYLMQAAFGNCSITGTTSRLRISIGGNFIDAPPLIVDGRTYNVGIQVSGSATSFVRISDDMGNVTNTFGSLFDNDIRPERLFAQFGGGSEFNAQLYEGDFVEGVMPPNEFDAMMANIKFKWDSNSPDITGGLPEFDSLDFDNIDFDTGF